MAAYVLVHGGGHGGWCYQRVARMLRAAGYDVYTPTLTGLQYEDLRDVILVGHSYGGMVITGVADRASDRVRRLVYLDAANPVNGQSLVDVSGQMILATRDQGRVIDGVELVLFPWSDAANHYGVTDPDDAAWMADRLTPHPWKCFEQPLRDRELMANVRAAGRLWAIDTGHDLMITEPRAVADALLKIATA